MATYLLVMVQALDIIVPNIQAGGRDGRVVDALIQKTKTIQPKHVEKIEVTRPKLNRSATRRKKDTGDHQRNSHEQLPGSDGEQCQTQRRARQRTWL